MKELALVTMLAVAILEVPANGRVSIIAFAAPSAIASLVEDANLLLL